jgi:hypothetical protein
VSDKKHWWQSNKGRDYGDAYQAQVKKNRIADSIRLDATRHRRGEATRQYHVKHVAGANAHNKSWVSYLFESWRRK